MDLFAAHDADLHPDGGRALVGTGVAVAVPAGYGALVVARSGLAARHGVTCLLSPGLIDSGYRGEVKVLLVNTHPTDGFVVTAGMRVAQLVVVAVPRVEFDVVTDLDSTRRGVGGFGSTGGLAVPDGP